MYCLLNGCLSLLSIPVIRHHDQNNLGEGFTYLLILICISIQRIQGRNSEQETGDRNPCREHTGMLPDWLVPHGFLKIFIIQPSATSPGWHCSTVGCPPSAVNHENASIRLAYRPIYWKHFVKWGSLFLADSSMWQVDKNTNQYRDIYHSCRK